MRMHFIHRFAAVGLALVFIALAQDNDAWAGSPTKVAFDIPQQPLSDALAAWSRQSGLQIFQLEGKDTENLSSSEVSGTFAPAEALEKMLAATGLTYEFVNERTVRIAPVRTGIRGSSYSASAQEIAGMTLAKNTGGESEARDTETHKPQELVVTGTHIKGAQSSSPVLTVTQEDLRLSGQNNLGEAIRALPQNFSGGQNPGVMLGAAEVNIANQNLTGSSGLNLRGLGPDASLTLINGRRLAYDSFVQAMDISVIPAAAVDKVEIVLDGASAIYGSDAVGGVANVVLKREYDGAEFSARYGSSTDGGNDQSQYTGVIGTRWVSGGLLFVADVARNSPIRAGERDYLGALPNPEVIVYPRLDQKTGVFNAHQSLGDSAELTLAAYHAKRRADMFMQTAVKFFRTANTTSWGVLPGMEFNLPRQWSLNVEGAYAQDESEVALPIYTVGNSFLFEQRTCYCNKSDSASVRFEGPLFALSDSQARLSVGSGYVRNTFTSINLFTGIPDTVGATRSRHVYGEIYLPLAEKLSVNAALRRENYDTFGGVTTPKFGAVWDPSASLRFKASWGKSFKVPTLSEQFQPAILNLNSAVGTIAGAPAGSTYLLMIGGNRNLGPERAEVTTAGLQFSPQLLPGLTVELGWFDIDYSDRVVAPLGGAVDINAPEFVIRNPTIAQQNAAIGAADQFPNFTTAPYDPATVLGLFENRYTNASSQHTRGVDLSVGYATTVNGWNLTALMAGNWMEGERRITDFSPTSATAGVVFYPPHVRARASMTWGKAGWTLASHVNYVDAVNNILVVPRERVSAMTTFDLVLGYQWNASVLGEMEFNLSASNVFDRRPPFMRPTSTTLVSFDSTNYSAIGRVVSASVTKRFTFEGR